MKKQEDKSDLVLGRIRQLHVNRGGRRGIVRDVVVIVVDDDGDAPRQLLWLLRMGGEEQDQKRTIR